MEKGLIQKVSYLNSYYIRIPKLTLVILDKNLSILGYPSATISYWRDLGDGSLPDADHDAEIILGYRDEENRTVRIRDIRWDIVELFFRHAWFRGPHSFKEGRGEMPQIRTLVNQDIGESEYCE
jgi:hypothetical protein